MRNIMRIVTALSAIAWGGPKIMDRVYQEVRRVCLEQISQPMTPLEEIAAGLTEKSRLYFYNYIGNNRK